MDVDPAAEAAPAGIRAARALLVPPPAEEPLWSLLGAAALFALSALSFAVAVIAGPPHFGKEDLPSVRPGITTPLQSEPGPT